MNEYDCWCCSRSLKFFGLDLKGFLSVKMKFKLFIMYYVAFSCVTLYFMSTYWSIAELLFLCSV